MDGTVIKQLREQLKVTQSDLAGQAGISRQSLINIENGKNDPGLKVFERLINALGYKLIIAVEP